LGAFRFSRSFSDKEFLFSRFYHKVFGEDSAFLSRAEAFSPNRLLNGVEASRAFFHYDTDRQTDRQTDAH
jgi:hypothetical protein